MKWQIWGMREVVAEKFPLFPLSRPAPAQPTSMLFPLCQQYWKTQYLSDIIRNELGFIWIAYDFLLSWCRLNFAELRKHERRHFPISHDTEFFLPHPSLFFPKTSLFISVFILPNNSLTMSKDYFFLLRHAFSPSPSPRNQLFAVWAFSAFSLSSFSHSLPLPPPAAGAQLSIGHSVGFGERLGGAGGCHLHFHKTRFDPKFS